MKLKPNQDVYDPQCEFYVIMKGIKLLWFICHSNTRLYTGTEVWIHCNSGTEFKTFKLKVLDIFFKLLNNVLDMTNNVTIFFANKMNKQKGKR